MVTPDLIIIWPADTQFRHHVRRLSTSAQFLFYAGRLQIVNSVLSSLPAYYMCSLKLPVAVIEAIDKYRKNCLSRGSDFRRKGYNLAAWKLVMKKEKEALWGYIKMGCFQ